jgi:hypothetical protein
MHGVPRREILQLKWCGIFSSVVLYALARGVDYDRRGRNLGDELASLGGDWAGDSFQPGELLT